MAKCPFAIQKILPENDDQPRITPRIAVVHSAGGRGSLYNFFLNGSPLESTFWVDEDGTIEQYMDTETRADANYKANGFALSIENSSSKNATEPFATKQAAANIRLLDWLCTTHPTIARQQCDKWDGTGIGWHIMFGSPGPWTPSAKVCPGPKRIEQVRYEIIPAVILKGSAAKPPKPTPPKEPFTVAQYDEIIRRLDDQDEILNQLKADYLTKGKGVRQSIAEIEAETNPDKPGTFATRTIESLTRIEAGKSNKP